MINYNTNSPQQQQQQQRKDTATATITNKHSTNSQRIHIQKLLPIDCIIPKRISYQLVLTKSIVLLFFVPKLLRTRSIAVSLHFKRRKMSNLILKEHADSIANDTDSQTLARLVMVRTHNNDLVILLNAIQTACKLVSRSVRKAGIAGLCKYLR